MKYEIEVCYDIEAMKFEIWNEAQIWYHPRKEYYITLSDADDEEEKYKSTNNKDYKDCTLVMRIVIHFSPENGNIRICICIHSNLHILHVYQLIHSFHRIH